MANIGHQRNNDKNNYIYNKVDKRPRPPSSGNIGVVNQNKTSSNGSKKELANVLENKASGVKNDYINNLYGNINKNAQNDINKLYSNFFEKKTPEFELPSVANRTDKSEKSTKSQTQNYESQTQKNLQLNDFSSQSNKTNSNNQEKSSENKIIDNNTNQGSSSTGLDKLLNLLYLIMP